MMYEYKKLSDNTRITYSRVFNTEKKMIVDVYFTRSRENKNDIAHYKLVALDNRVLSETGWIIRKVFTDKEINEFEELLKNKIDFLHLSTASAISVEEEMKIWMSAKVQESAEMKIKEKTQEDHKQYYGLADVTKEAYQIQYGKIPLDRSSASKDIATSERVANYCDMAEGWFRDFCMLFDIDSDQIRKKNGYHFSKRNKDFLARLLSEYTTTSSAIQRIRMGEINQENLEIYWKMICGAEDLLVDNCTGEAALHAALKKMYKRVGYKEMICDIISKRITDMLYSVQYKLRNDDIIAWLKWVYQTGLDSLVKVAYKMADIRNTEINVIIENSELKEDIVQTNIDISLLMEKWNRLESDIAYQELVEEKRKLEYPKGRKGSRLLTIRFKELDKIDSQMRQIEERIMSELGIVEDQQDDTIMRNLLQEKMQSSKEVLEEAILDVGHTRFI